MLDRSGSGPAPPRELEQEVVALRESLARGRTPGPDAELARTHAELVEIQAHLQRLFRQLEERDFGG